ncbi:hypothetical protein [Vibrio brasiliensis]|uniref:Uncharacterized protein n=1 Tax=Vibrio brasiliensis LMG 20546 TaxID=945543 RepID=E8LRY9_9VIBR|nr:hypothetical protein [Vibrio brasiliensis]EGA66486.1 hypothetical protein VIBR0546_10839 [Vibrio brasiliensis LMG 20546]
MKFFWVALLLLTSFYSSAKSTCSEPFIDIKSDFLVKELFSVDKDSKEPTVRQFIIYDTGGMAIIEQKTCLMTNVQIDYYFNGRNYIDKVNNFLNIFDQIKNKHNLKVNNDIAVSLVELLKSGLFLRDSIVITSPTESVEYDFSLDTYDLYEGLYTNRLSFYMNIGGL